MDERKIMAKINAGIPKELVNGISKTVVDNSGRDLVENALRDGRYSAAERRKMQRVLDSGALNKKSTTVDREVTAKIDAYLDKRIRDEMKAGRLKPARQDGFQRRMRMLTGH